MKNSATLSEAQAALTLNAIPGVGPALCRRLADAFDGALASALAASAETLEKIPGIGRTLAAKIAAHEREFSLAKEEKKMREHGFEFVPFFDARFPVMLREIPDAPIGVYVFGNVAALGTRRAIAIVGTRRASLYGSSMARKIARELALSRWTVVSGLARGIDTAAHVGALDGNGATVAVLGCGLDIVYPPENLELYRKIAETGGAVISEFRLGRVADRRTFPQRNRIIAGLSAGMLVVESDEKGGSMLSAGFAADYGRTVFALPGRVDQDNSRGCHKLIREGATLVTGAGDIVEEMESVASQPSLALDFGDAPARVPAPTSAGTSAASEALAALPPEAVAIHALLAAGDALSPDEIAERADLPAAAVLSNLLLLELERLVARKADGTYEKTL